MPNSEARMWRRFIPIGTEKELDRLESLMKEKSLSREDLVTVLRAIRLNPCEKIGGLERKPYQRCYSTVSTGSGRESSREDK